MAEIALKLLVLKTRQLGSLLTFYRLLGIEFTEEQHGNGPIHYSSVLGSTVLELYPLSDNSTSADQSIRLGFSVANLDKMIASLQANDIRNTLPK